MAVGSAFLQDPQRSDRGGPRRPRACKRRAREASQGAHNRRHGRADIPRREANIGGNWPQRQTRPRSYRLDAVYGGARVDPNARAGRARTKTRQTARCRSRRTTQQARPASARGTPTRYASPSCALSPSSPGWTRTNNPPVNSRMLCQLSYWGKRASVYRSSPAASARERLSGRELFHLRTQLRERRLELERSVRIRVRELASDPTLAQPQE